MFLAQHADVAGGEGHVMTESITSVSSMPKKSLKKGSSSKATPTEKAAIAQLVKAAGDRVRTG